MIKLQKKRAWQSAGEKNLKFLSQYFSLIKYCSCDYGKSFTTVLTSISYKSCCYFTIFYDIGAVAQSTCTRGKWIKKTYFPIIVVHPSMNFSTGVAFGLSSQGVALRDSHLYLLFMCGSPQTERASRWGTSTSSSTLWLNQFVYSNYTVFYLFYQHGAEYDL